MGHQITFYLSLSDTIELEKRLVSSEDMLILHDRSRGPYPRIVDSVDLVEGKQRQHFFYFVRRTDLDSVVTQEIKTQGHWSIDGMFSPVVEFSLGNFDGNTIRPGRLYYNDVYYNDAGKLVGKTRGFDVWAKKVLSKARQTLKYDKSLLAYVGEEAIQMQRSGIELRQF